MVTKVFNFPTIINGMIMTHKLSERITVVTDLSILQITVFRDMEPIDKIDCRGMTLSYYGLFLKNKLEALEPAEKTFGNGN